MQINDLIWFYLQAGYLAKTDMIDRQSFSVQLGPEVHTVRWTKLQVSKLQLPIASFSPTIINRWHHWPTTMNETARSNRSFSGSTGRLLRFCSNYERPEINGCVLPEKVIMDDGGYTVTVCGYVIPLAVALTVVTNGLICAVLLQKKMRTASNVLLVAMAVADMMTGLSTMPAYLHFYTLGAYLDYIPYTWLVRTHVCV